MITRALVIAMLSLLIATTACMRVNGQQEAGEGSPKGGFILQPEEGEVLRLGGPPGGQVIIKVDPTKTGSPQIAMGIQYVEGEIPLHQHEHEEEFLFVHTGHGIGILGDQRVPVQAGTTIYIPPGTWHGFQNTADKASQIMWVVTPGSGGKTQLEHFLRAVGALPGTDVKSLTPDQFADVMEKHGMKAKP